MGVVWNLIQLCSSGASQDGGPQTGPSVSAEYPQLLQREGTQRRYLSIMKQRKRNQEQTRKNRHAFKNGPPTAGGRGMLFAR